MTSVNGRDLVGRRDLDVDRLAVVEELHRHRHRALVARPSAPNVAAHVHAHPARQAVAVDPHVDGDLGVADLAQLLERGLDLRALGSPAPRRAPRPGSWWPGSGWWRRRGPPPAPTTSGSPVTPRSDSRIFVGSEVAGPEPEARRRRRRGPPALIESQPVAPVNISNSGDAQVDGVAVGDHLHGAVAKPAGMLLARGGGELLEHRAHVHRHGHLLGLGVVGAGGDHLERSRPSTVISMTISNAGRAGVGGGIGRGLERARPRRRRSSPRRRPSSPSLGAGGDEQERRGEQQCELAEHGPSQGVRLVVRAGAAPWRARRAPGGRSVPTRRDRPVGTSTIDHRSRDGERGRLNRKQALSLVLRIGLSALDARRC